MSKVYKGYELLKAIADGEIKEGSRFIVKLLDEIVFYTNDSLWYEGDDEELCASTIIESEFELIEDETIDIDNIEEIKWRESEKEYLGYGVLVANEKINKLVQAVKQLNKEIKSIKEK